MTHRCHARGCSTPVRPELLMCYPHWRKVPPRLQRLVWATYRPGQCDDKQPSRAWHDAASAAIGFVALLEGEGVTRGELRCLLDADYESVIGVVLSRRSKTFQRGCARIIAEIKAETATRRDADRKAD